MATDGAIGRRKAAAIARIEQRCQRWKGEQLRLPTASRYGADVLLVLQLEALADFLEDAPLEAIVPPTSLYADMTNKQLVAEIEARGLERGKASNKQQLADILAAADRAARLAEQAEEQDDA